MDAKEILKRIMDSGGSCSWIEDTKICKNCPLSKLKRRTNGEYYSCLGALKIDINDRNLNINRKYMMAAERLYINLLLEEELLKK